MAAAPISVPALQKGDRISDWRVLFESGTQHVRPDEASEKKVINLLPNYVNRSVSDTEAVKMVMKKANTLKEALDELAKVIDNPIDPFLAMQELVKLQWQPGQDIGDYFFLTRRKAVHAGTTLKFVASMVSSQLPKEVQNRVKGTVTAINEDLEHADAFKLIAEIKETLTDRGFALNLGSRNGQPTNTIATVKEGSEDGDLLECTEIYCPNNRVAFTRNRQGGKRQTRGSEQQERRDCYICGGRHYWRFCPEKRCPSCGQKGHTLKDCSILSKGRNSHSVLSTKLDGLGAELSVLIAMKLNGKQTNGLLDSGAGPSVIDIGTVRELGLEQSMRIKEGQVYGISREPVYVVGELELTVDLGDKQVLEHKFEVLKVTGTTCILGRDLLKKLGTTEFNWQSQK